MMPEQKDWYSMRETMDLLGCSRQSVYNLIKRKKLQPLPRTTALQQPLRFARGDVDALVPAETRAS